MVGAMDFVIAWRANIDITGKRANEVPRINEVFHAGGVNGEKSRLSHMERELYPRYGTSLWFLFILF